MKSIHRKSDAPRWSSTARRRISAALGTTAVAVAASIWAMAAPANAATSAHAMPAVSCYGDYCSGQDPSATGCAADAYTVTSYNDSVGSLQLRWSPTCKTNWTRLVVYPTGHAIFMGGSLWAIQDTGYSQEYNVPTNSGGTFWTAMIYSPSHCVKSAYYGNYNIMNGAVTGCY